MNVVQEKYIQKSELMLFTFLFQEELQLLPSHHLAFDSRNHVAEKDENKFLEVRKKASFWAFSKINLHMYDKCIHNNALFFVFTSGRMSTIKSLLYFRH